MFRAEEETDRDWDKDLADDVREECEAKYGRVEAIKVDTESTSGEIRVRFADLDGAKKAIQGLNGRFFGGRTVSAVYMSEGFLASSFDKSV
jgi:RNA-binding protein 39